MNKIYKRYARINVDMLVPTSMSDDPEFEDILLEVYANLFNAIDRAASLAQRESQLHGTDLKTSVYQED